MTAIPTPSAFLGHEVCADFQLAGYQRLRSYWRALAAASARLRVCEIGTTSDGLPHEFALVTSEANSGKLDGILAKARIIAYPDRAPADCDEATLLDGPAVVYLGAGVHTSEVVTSESLFELSYQLCRVDNPEVERWLEQVVVVIGHGNPDGHEYAATNYMKPAEPSDRAAELRCVLPFMKPSYSGSDNNRDFLAARLPETRNINRALYETFCPQVILDAHQTGPLGAAMYLPPYKEPLSPGVDASLVTMTSELGLSLHGRLLGEGKNGSYFGQVTEYQQWAFGMLPCPLHNVVTFHTEVIGTPHPQRIPAVIDKQLPQMGLPRPIEPRLWHARDGLAYQMSAYLGVLDWVRRNRDRLLATVYGANLAAVAAGKSESWTTQSDALQELGAAHGSAIGADELDDYDRAGGVTTGNLRGGTMVRPELFETILRSPERRNAIAYILPLDQHDPGALADFCDAMMSNGVAIGLTQTDLRQGSVLLPAGSLIIPAAQSKRGVIQNAFDPQSYPVSLARSEGGSPAQYGAGQTLALQMGLTFHRILEGALPEFAPLQSSSQISPPSSQTSGEVIAAERQTSVSVGICDVFGGLSNAGWTRWLLDREGIRHQTLFPRQIAEDAWRDDIDVLIIPDGRAPVGFHPPAPGEVFPDPPLAHVDPAFHHMVGAIGSEAIAQIAAFIKDGGRVILVGSATGWLEALSSKVVLRTFPVAPGEARPIYGKSIMLVQTSTHPLTEGLPAGLNITFTGRCFEPGAADTIASFADASPLLSGLAIGQWRLQGAVLATYEALGKGSIVAFAFDPVSRGQSSNTFGLLTNAILQG
ncbi:MAG TPA: M14 family zinc carboxypeptidase [Bosea sp. (in: a-proteobacteria)]|jgi:hypothetical protein|uniref:M14 family zinc carboxypeptidase n=1 Tax=Bosea sp. (in: a-proteobacteria) TaxID=1871050 RepID=UPI002E137627|nr:M14 family zinc carboxypeptidase [Bosea sp. (in: a-proteobacteria)]